MYRPLLLLLALVLCSCRPSAPPIESDGAPTATNPGAQPARPELPPVVPDDAVASVQNNANGAMAELPDLPEDRDVPQPRAYLRRTFRAAAEALSRSDPEGARRILTAPAVTENLAELELDRDYEQYVNTRVLMLDLVQSYTELEDGDPWHTDVTGLRDEIEEILGVRKLDVDLGLADVDTRARTLRDFHQILIHLELGQFADVSASLRLMFRRIGRAEGGALWKNKVRRAAQRIADAVMEVSAAAPDPEDAPAPTPEDEALPDENGSDAGDDADAPANESDPVSGA